MVALDGVVTVDAWDSEGEAIHALAAPLEISMPTVVCRKCEKTFLFRSDGSSYVGKLFGVN